MCGIFGYVGPRNPAKICLRGLKKLEYRGYDSAGLAGILEGKILSCKEMGKIHVLESALERQQEALELAIAHTRWATHGEPSKDNAHPHFDQSHSIALVHNGIIENHSALREALVSKGKQFYSQTDTEVIAQLVADCYTGDLVQAVQHTLSHLKGFWGIALIHKDHPNQIIAAAKQNPIAIGFNPHTFEAFVSSDANAFDDPHLDVFFLSDGEIALLTPTHVSVLDAEGRVVHKQTQRLEMEAAAISKNGYPHFMLKEIFEQPETVHQTFHNRLDFKAGSAHFEELTFSLEELAAVDKVVILACGTSAHAGEIAASLFEDKARLSATSEIASEFRYKNPLISPKTLFIAISQSGETLDTIAAVREVKARGAKVLGICNVRNSTLTREADCSLFQRAGREVSVCSTKAFTSQLTLLSLFVLLMARLRHMDVETGRVFLGQIEQLPSLITQVLNLHVPLQALAKKYAHFEQMFFLGRHYMYATSLEAALKLKEISYLNAQAYPAGEMKHGPIALVDPKLAVVGLCGNMHTLEKMGSNLAEIKARNAPIIAFAPAGCKEIEAIATDLITLPAVPDALASIPYSIAAQLFAYYVALERGTDIDQPRNLAKSVTVE